MLRRTWILAALVIVVVTPQSLADDVEATLKKWAKHIANQPRTDVHGTAKVYTYDLALRRETRHRVEFWVSGPEEWRIDSAPLKVGDESSRKLAEDGKHFQLESTRSPWRWSRSTSMLVFMQDTDGTPSVRSWQVYDRPADVKLSFFQMLSAWPSEAAEVVPLPIQLSHGGPVMAGGDVKSMREAFNVESGTLNGKNGQVHLALEPRVEPFKGQYSRIELLLKELDFSPLAYRTFDPAGTTETVHVFEGAEPVPYDTDPFGNLALSTWPPKCQSIRSESRR